jgi:hypothetical protein
VLVRTCAVPVDIAPGGQVERTVCGDETALRVLWRVAGINRPSAPPWKFRKARGKIDSKSKFEVRAVIQSPIWPVLVAKMLLFVIGFVDFAPGIPKKLPNGTQAAQIQGLFLWGAGRCRRWQERLRDLADRRERQEATYQQQNAPRPGFSP